MSESLFSFYAAYDHAFCEGRVWLVIVCVGCAVDRRFSEFPPGEP